MNAICRDLDNLHKFGDVASDGWSETESGADPFRMIYLVLVLRIGVPYTQVQLGLTSVPRHLLRPINQSRGDMWHFGVQIVVYLRFIWPHVCTTTLYSCPPSYCNRAVGYWYTWTWFMLTLMDATSSFFIHRFGIVGDSDTPTSPHVPIYFATCHPHIDRAWIPHGN